MVLALVGIGATGPALAQPGEAESPCPTGCKPRSTAVMVYGGVGVGAAWLGNYNDQLVDRGFEESSLVGVRPDIGLRLEPATGPAIALSYGMLLLPAAKARESDAEIHAKLEHLILHFEFPVRSSSGWRLYPGTGIGFGRTLVRREKPHFETFADVATGTEGTAAISSYEILLDATVTGGYLIPTARTASGFHEGFLIGLRLGATASLSSPWRDGHAPAGILLPLFYFADHRNTLFEEESFEDTLRIGPLRPHAGIVIGFGSARAAR
jgi:hypothetical protein